MYRTYFYFILTITMIALPHYANTETEPNQTFLQANPIQINTSVEGYLSTNNVIDTIDVFIIETESDGFLQIGVVPTVDLDLEISLRDQNGLYELAAKNATQKGGTESIVYPRLLSGTYYLIIKIPDTVSNVEGDYTATVSFLPVEENDPEPNDTFAQAAPFSVNSEISGHLGYYGAQYQDNRDIFEITLPDDGRLELTVYPDGTSNIAISLYDSVIINQLRSVNSKQLGESEILAYPNLLAGTYYVIVEQVSGYGSYNLTSLFTPNPYPSQEPNDDPEHANQLQLADGQEQSLQGRLRYFGNQKRDDFDYIRLTIPSFGDLTTTITADGGESLNWSLSWYDEEFRLISESTNLTNLYAGSYYVRILGTSGYGHYTAKFNFTAKAEPVPLNVTANDISPNQIIQNIRIDADNPTQWYQVSLPEDGHLKIITTFTNSIYAHTHLFSANGLTEMRNINSWWSNDPKEIEVPNIRKGTYLIRLNRNDGGSDGILETQFTPTSRNDLEPNDLITNLSTVPYNASYSGHVGHAGNGKNDFVDYYQIDIPEDGSITINTTSQSTLYFYLRLFGFQDNSWREYAQTNGWWTNDERSISSPNIMAGRYLVEFKRIDGFGEYDLDIQFTPNRSNDPEINGDDWTQAPTVQLDQGYVGKLGYTRNTFLDIVDHYKIVLPEDGNLNITFQTEASAYLRYKLFHSDQKTLVVETNSWWSNALKSIGNNQLLAGEYYLQIERADGFGTYHFYMDYEPQLIEDGDTHFIASQANNVNLYEYVQGTLGYHDLYGRNLADWYRVVVEQEATYRLQFHGTNKSYFNIELFKDDMVTRVHNHNRWWTSAPSQHDLTLMPGTYYIKISRSDGYGEYNFVLGNDQQRIGTQLSGSVKTITNFPLAEIDVSVLGLTTKTDAAGQFVFDQVPAGIYPVSFQSGTKYYPDTVITEFLSNESKELNVVLFDSNRTPPKDVQHFHAVPEDAYIHFLWSPSISPDVADGGGYKLYINSEPEIDIGNDFVYRSLGFENGVTYSCRLAVYDKYGNESDGKTIQFVLEGSSTTPTPTPTTVIEPTPTALQTPAGTLTPTVTPTPTIPGVTPVPTVPVSTPTPGSLIEPEPDYVFEFEQDTLIADGWSQIPGGFNNDPAASIIVPFSLDNFIPTSLDGIGIAVKTSPKQVMFLLTSQAINTGGHPVLMRAKIRANQPDASIAMGALKGELLSGVNVDGSIGLDQVNSAATYLAQAGTINVVYQPDSGELITPFIQVYCQGPAAVDVYIDRLEIYIMSPEKTFPANMFRIH